MAKKAALMALQMDKKRRDIAVSVKRFKCHKIDNENDVETMSKKIPLSLLNLLFLLLLLLLLLNNDSVTVIIAVWLRKPGYGCRTPAYGGL